MSDEEMLAAMARFEAALARASAKMGLFPETDADTIAQVCQRASFDTAELAGLARHAGTLAIPFVKQLTEQVASVSQEASRYVHFGATSQDLLDTALALCLRNAWQRLDALHVQLGDAAASLARAHSKTALAARTLLQPALPVPFGWKAAVWLSMIARSRRALSHAIRDACVLQFGGAGGTLSAYQADGDAIARLLGAELGLPTAAITWHSARDGFARVGAEAAISAGVAGKIARDISLLMQPEVAEASEPLASGRGGSSSLPHKRNPASCMLALEAALRTPGLVATLLGQLTPEHERGLGQWQGQWLTLRELLGASGSALAAMSEVLEGLEVHAQAMAVNLDRSHGLIYSEAVSIRLSRQLGKAAAHKLTERLCETAVREKKNLLDVMRMDAEVAHIVPQSEIADLFEPNRCFGSAQPMIERILALWTEVRATSPGTAP